MVVSLKWTEPTSLTLHQRDLKWSLYCEVETFEDISDIKVVLESLIRDINKQEKQNSGQNDRGDISMGGIQQGRLWALRSGPNSPILYQVEPRVPKLFETHKEADSFKRWLEESYGPVVEVIEINIVERSKAERE